VIILLTVTIVQRTIGFGRGILFCRWLSPEALGQWEMVYSFLMLAAPLAVLGVPGSFGRYAEHYRQRGHLRTFLRRATTWTLACTIVAAALVNVFAEEISSLIFGRQQEAALMRDIALCLAAVVFHHTLSALLTALRLYRIVSAMNFAQSILFAGISLALIWRQPSLASILYAYAVGCLIASAGALYWAWPALRAVDSDASAPLGHVEFWGKLLRFAFFVWVTNLLTNLFAIIDRAMLVHCGGMTPDEALDQIGHYHSSRIIPLLMVSVADLLAGLVMPHLSHDWETGRRAQASQRLNLAVKLTSLGMLAFGAAVLAAGPFIFGVVLQGRYDNGLAVLPWTMAGCVCYGVYVVAQCYLWVVERTRLTVVPLLLGLAVNVLLNLVLVPAYALYGAVLATGVSTLVCLLSVLELSRRCGLEVDRGTWLLAVAPIALGFGPWPAMAVCLAAAVAAAGTSTLISPVERRALVDFAVGSIVPRLPRLGRRGEAGG
jgi:O-antigen/teichoic acid export membrane protein